MKKLAFIKMQAQGNDFVFLDGIRQELSLGPKEIARITSRHYGVGCDQIICCEPPYDPEADFFMRVYNSDGSTSEQCGNGARCFVQYVRLQGFTNRREIVLETANRNLNAKLLKESLPNKKSIVEVGMGVADFAVDKVLSPKQISSLSAGKGGYHLSLNNGPEEPKLPPAHPVSFGNPHLIYFVKSKEQAKQLCDSYGETLSNHPALINGANIGFLAGSGTVFNLYTYERGAGMTQACGSNSCAAFAVARKVAEIGKEADIIMRGGKLKLRINPGTQEIYTTGEVVETFNGYMSL